MYDLIGDIHGHADELMQLLAVLGYRRTHGVYRHPDRRAIFLGDLIDRGPQIREVLEIARPMVEGGHALAVMGNHELNALAFYTPDPKRPGDFARRHTDGNKRQIRRTIEQLKTDELDAYLEWFRTLPLYLDLEGIRAVHACWDRRAIGEIADAVAHFGGITAEFLQAAYDRDNALFDPIEVTLKGKDAQLPNGTLIRDKDGGFRTEISTRWYLSPDGHTYQSYALQSDAIECAQALDESVVAGADPYPLDAKPVFIGHFWLSSRHPEILAENVACLDYSVAKGGLLCAYRWEGEQKLTNSHLVWVSARS